MSQMEVVGEISSARFNNTGKEDPRPLEFGPAKVYFDISSAIASGDIPLEDVTGGISVDAETGEISGLTEPSVASTEWDEASVRQALLERGSRIARGMHRLNSRTFRRPAGTAATIETRRVRPKMPRKLTPQERLQADQALVRDNQTRVSFA